MKAEEFDKTFDEDQEDIIAEAFDQKFDEGQEDIVDDLDLSRLRRPGCKQWRIDGSTEELQLHSYE